MEFTCPKCRAVLEIPDEHAGQRVGCRKCGTKFVLPESKTEQATSSLAAGKGSAKVYGCLFCLVATIAVLILSTGRIDSVSKQPAEIRPTVMHTESVPLLPRSVETELEFPADPGYTYEGLEYTAASEDVTSDVVNLRFDGRYVVWGDLTKENLSDFLHAKAHEGFRRLRDQSRTRGWDTVKVWVCAFSSEERIETFQWIGNVFWNSCRESKWSLGIDEEELNARDIPPERRFGLREEIRKEIYKEIWEVEDTAYSITETLYPSYAGRFLRRGDTFRSRSTLRLLRYSPEYPVMNIGDEPHEISPGHQITVLGNDGEWVHLEAREPGFDYVVKGWAPFNAFEEEFPQDMRTVMGQKARRIIIDPLEMDLARRYGLTPEQLGEIETEGGRKAWTRPLGDDTPATPEMLEWAEAAFGLRHDISTWR
ncbi:MAG: hypothetical protein GWP08_12485 [Nitrospiraceae bacterium]|nr:hypothetical protein [Nitrospiraceae bacterium]